MDTLEDVVRMYLDALDRQRAAIMNEHSQAEFEDSTLDVKRYEARLREIMSFTTNR
jgi:hypothetical protein